MSKIPELLWYQDKTHVYLSYQIMNPKDVAVNFEKLSVDFSACGENNQKYQVKFECFKEIVPEKSSWKITGREVSAVLQKSEVVKWVRLLKEGKPHYVKANWAHTMYDSDDEKEEMGDFGMGGGMPPMNFDEDAMGEMGDSEEGEHPDAKDDCCKDKDCGKCKEESDSDSEVKTEHKGDCCSNGHCHEHHDQKHTEVSSDAK